MDNDDKSSYNLSDDDKKKNSTASPLSLLQMQTHMAERSR